jgi:hypothetical protein
MPLSGHSQVSFTRYPSASPGGQKLFAILHAAQIAIKKDAGIPADIEDAMAGR